MKTEYLLLGFILAGLFTLYGCGYNPTKDAMGLCLQAAAEQRPVSVSASSGKTDYVDCKIGEKAEAGA